MEKYRRRIKRSYPNLLILLLSLFILWCSLFLIKSIPKKIPPPEILIPAKIAIIIDDFGYRKEAAQKIYEIPAPITLSILPYLPYSSEIARTATVRGYEVMLHLPMEPLSHLFNPGRGAIYTKMSDGEVACQTKNDIANLPSVIKGVNNHMGSRATANERVMKTVLQELKKRNLYYIDSVTSEGSLGFTIARELGLRTAKRDIFLDNKKDADYIRTQLRKLMARALENKEAIGIGHAHSITLEVIKEMIPEIEKKGIKLVFASEIVK